LFNSIAASPSDLAIESVSAVCVTTTGPTRTLVGSSTVRNTVVVGTGPAAFTAAVAFDPAAGWTDDKAATWLAAKLGSSAGRVASFHTAGPTAPLPRTVAVG